MKSTSTLSIRLLLILAAVMIICGHVVIMASGELFDKVNGESYNLHSRWVSDFAAKWPEGSWIKVGILLTCVASGLLYRAKIKGLPLTARHSLESWLYHLVPFVMIIGLILVLSYDVSRPREQWEYRGIWPFRFAKLVNAEKESSEWVIDWYHRLGFRVFVGGFFAAVVGGLMFRKCPTTPLDWLILLSALVCAGWLFITMKSLPGISQRFLLATAFVWLWRETDLLHSRSSPPQSGARPSTTVP